jgi:hypothetical protein
MFFDILNICMRKGIKIDKEVQNVKNIDFKILRSQSKCVTLCYIHPKNTLILISDSHDFISSEEQLKMFLTEVSKMPDLETLRLDFKESITINGKEYSKKVFEGATDSKFELFIKNLELEAYLNAE